MTPPRSRSASVPRLLQLFASGRLTAVWTNYRPFVEQQREQHGDPLLHEQLEKVATSWPATT